MASEVIIFQPVGNSENRSRLGDVTGEYLSEGVVKPKAQEPAFLEGDEIVGPALPVRPHSHIISDS